MRLIDADELLEKAEYIPTGLKSRGMCVGFHGVTVGAIENAPTIAPESLRPTAHWEGFQADGKDDRFEFTLNAINICSKCKHISMQKSKYCPYCGAKMEG